MTPFDDSRYGMHVTYLTPPSERQPKHIQLLTPQMFLVTNERHRRVMQQQPLPGGISSSDSFRLQGPKPMRFTSR
jgi:hypothetical protein